MGPPLYGAFHFKSVYWECQELSGTGVEIVCITNEV
jgi:hypothetical protein